MFGTTGEFRVEEQPHGGDTRTRSAARFEAPEPRSPDRPHGMLGGYRRSHDPSEVLGREELVWADSFGDDAKEAVRVLVVRPQRAEECLLFDRRRRE